MCFTLLLWLCRNDNPVALTCVFAYIGNSSLLCCGSWSVLSTFRFQAGQNIFFFLCSRGFWPFLLLTQWERRALCGWVVHPPISVGVKNEWSHASSSYHMGLWPAAGRLYLSPYSFQTFLFVTIFTEVYAIIAPRYYGWNPVSEQFSRSTRYFEFNDARVLRTIRARRGSRGNSKTACSEAY